MKWIFIAVVILESVVSNPALAGNKDRSDWRARMNSLSTAMTEAIPFLYPDPSQDAKQLTEKVKRIRDIAKSLDLLSHGSKVPDQDPALPFIATQFREDTERAYQSLIDGHADYAKGLIRASVAYCIACHTRAPGGNQFPLMSAFEKTMARASWVERIEFQAASRQFDSALEGVKSQLKKKDSEVSAMDMDRAARVALAIAIRVKNDPQLAADLARELEKSPSSNFAMKKAGETWGRDIQEWKKEAAVKHTSPDALMVAARALISRAEAAEEPIGGHGEVRYLRASLLMHDLLRQHPESKFAAEAMYIIGSAYDALRDLGLWSLHETYFLACIEKVPGTEMAQRCFKKYDQSVTLGFSGSSGINIPANVRKHIAKLKNKAYGK